MLTASFCNYNREKFQFTNMRYLHIERFASPVTLASFNFKSIYCFVHSYHRPPAIKYQIFARYSRALKTTFFFVTVHIFCHRLTNQNIASIAVRLESLDRSYDIIRTLDSAHWHDLQIDTYLEASTSYSLYNTRVHMQDNTFVTVICSVIG